jgi:serine O-acetyltransferase
MEKNIKKSDHSCRIDAESLSRFKQQLPDVTESIIASCYDKESFTHIDYEPIPSEGYVVDIIHKLREILFPGYFTR